MDWTTVYSYLNPNYSINTVSCEDYIYVMMVVDGQWYVRRVQYVVVISSRCCNLRSFAVVTSSFIRRVFVRARETDDVSRDDQKKDEITDRRRSRR